MKIVVISPSYPTQGKNKYPFVEALCNAWADLGHSVTVITPISSTNRLIRKKNTIKMKQITYVSQVGNVIVYSPTFITVGKLPIIGEWINNRNKERCIWHTFKRNRIDADVIYAHFWRSGIDSYPTAKRLETPLFVASGESIIDIQDISAKYKKEIADYVSNVICVSTKNKNESIRLGLTNIEKCVVMPNSIDFSVFNIKDKWKLRERYRLRTDDFIVAFVGFFIKRKGPKRVCDAISILNKRNIKSIFIGSTANQEPEEPEGDFIIFKGVLAHEEIADYLNAADVFVLPTLHEGCCNAIIEAMACGLPIISSDRDFNYDILDDTNSILIDPEDTKAIASAIQTLYEDEDKRHRLSQGSIQRSKNLDIRKRAEGIIGLMQKSIVR